MSKFLAGQSGNPAGRPRGIKDRRTIFAQMLNQHKQQLFDKALELALSGDPQMLRLLLSRFLPAAPRDNPIEITLSGSINEQCEEVTTLISQALITPNEGLSLLQVLSEKAKLDQNEKLIERLAAIEITLKQRGK